MSAAVHTGEQLPRVYKAWKGNNVFCLQGRFIFGPDARSVFLTMLLIVAPVSIFCAFVAKNIMSEFSYSLGLAVLVVTVVYAACDITLLLLTSGRDPGIVPRNPRHPEPEDVGSSHNPQLCVPRVKDVSVNGISVKVKYCDTCMLYRRPRCSHCSICDNCVERFDHHCPWVGQCIGLRNYRFFFMFIFSTTLLCLYVFAFCWVYIIKIKNAEHISIWKAMARTPASIALICYTFVSVLFVGGLSSFHIYLMSTNQTTYENFRYRYDQRVNPHNRGIVANIGEIFCTPIPPSQINFRARITEELGTGSASASHRQRNSRFTISSMESSVGDIENGRKTIASDEPRIAADIGDLGAGLGKLFDENGHRNPASSPDLNQDTLPSDVLDSQGPSGPHPGRPSWGLEAGR